MDLEELEVKIRKENITNLSKDVASFYNITQDEAYKKLTSVSIGGGEW